MESSGVDRIVVISNHKFIKQFTSWAEKRSNTTVIDDGSLDNDHRLGAVKDIEFAIDLLNLNDDLIVLDRDNVLDFSFKGFIEYGKAKKRHV